jgi:hypothetical protein
MVLRAHGLTMALGESKRIWLGVVFTDCAFSHSGLLLGFDVQRIGSKQCIALNRYEPATLIFDSLRNRLRCGRISAFEA